MISHLLLLFLIISAISGLFSLTLSFLVCNKVKCKKIVIYRILMILFFSVIVLPGIWRTYAENSGLETVRIYMLDPPYIAIFLLSAISPVYANLFSIYKFRKLLNIIFISIPIITFTINTVLYPYMPLLVFQFLAPITLFISLIYGSITFLIGKNSKLRDSYPLRKVEAIGMLIMMPVFTLSDISLLFARDFFESIPFSILGVPLYLIFHCILTLIEDFKILSNKNLKITDEDIESLKEKYDLTAREMEVVSCAIKGLSYPEIAEELFIAFSTAKTHMQNIYRKTKTSSKIELIMKAVYKK